MRFHLATEIGDYLISTVGMYVHPRHSGGNENSECEWLAEHPNGEEIGLDRTYETYVFKLGDVTCGCGCGVRRPVEWCEIDGRGANDPATATRNHREFCDKYAATPSWRDTPSKETDDAE